MNRECDTKESKINKVKTSGEGIENDGTMAAKHETAATAETGFFIFGGGQNEERLTTKCTPQRQQTIGSEYVK